MIRQLLPFVTGMVTLIGMWAAGSHRSWSWGLGIANQALWFAFIVAFGAWGLLPLNVALVVVYSRNLLKWRREARVLDATFGKLGADSERGREVELVLLNWEDGTLTLDEAVERLTR